MRCAGSNAIGRPARAMAPRSARSAPEMRLSDRGLAGPIGADQPEDFAAAKRKARVVDGDQAAEGLAHVRELQDRRVVDRIVLRRARPYEPCDRFGDRRHGNMMRGAAQQHLPATGR